jgi:hypothetical protein
VLVGDVVIVEDWLTVVEPVSDPLDVCDGVCADVLVLLEVGEFVLVTDALIVDVDEAVPLSLPVIEGPAPFVTDAVGECEIDLERLSVVDDVGEGVAVLDDESEPDEEAVGVKVPEAVLVALTVAVALEESEILGVIDADAPIERELVGV